MWHRRRRWLTALVAALSTAQLAAAAASADTGYPVTYFGGPVAHSMTGVIVDWGPDINPAYTDATTGDPGLIKYFAASSGATADFGGVLAQYMDSSGENAANEVSYGNQFEIAPSVTGTTIEDGQLQTELVKQIDAGHLPTPAGTGLSTVYLGRSRPGTRSASTRATVRGPSSAPITARPPSPTARRCCTPCCRTTPAVRWPRNADRRARSCGTRPRT